MKKTSILAVLAVLAFAGVAAAESNFAGPINVTGAQATVLTFEGVTDNAYETTITVVDPTADRSIGIPNASGYFLVGTTAVTTAYDPITSTTANTVDGAASVWGASGGLVFEGATANAFETTIGVVDPTADNAIEIPNASGTVMLSTGGVDAAGGLWGAGQDLKYEGTTANAFEQMLRFWPEPTADSILIVPGVLGTLSADVTANATQATAQTSTTAESAGFTYTTIAGAFAQAGDHLRITCWGSTTYTNSGGSTLKVKLYLDDAAAATAQLDVDQGAASTYQATMDIFVTGAATQDYTTMVLADSTSDTIAIVHGTATIDYATAKTIKVSALGEDAGDGTTIESCVFEMVADVH